MRAAVVTSFDRPPMYQEFPEPTSQTQNEVVVDVLATGLHPRVRSQASGSHYASTDELPLIPGIDGVGRAPDGTLRYFVLPDTAFGAMAERTVVDLRRSIVLPDGIDPAHLAAAMNPVMSSWVALRRRVTFTPGHKVLVLGATGNAGRLAVQVAKHFGAGSVIGAGRNADRLAELADLGADATITLGPASTDDEFARLAADVDVVLDYLWGPSASEAMAAMLLNRADPGRQLTWIQIGSMAGQSAGIPSAALRAARLQIVGSGQGSVPARDFLAELPELAAAIGDGQFSIDAHAVPLSDVEAAWADTDSSRRIVITP